MVFYWIRRIRKCRDICRSVAEESFKLVKTTLYDKECKSVRRYAGESRTYIYNLIFTRQSRINCKFRKTVSEYEFVISQTGDECYLMLCPDSKSGSYVIKRIFWLNKTVLSDELEKYIVYDSEKKHLKNAINKPMLHDVNLRCLP